MDVIWIASYPRSGNTWFRFLLSSYFFGQAEDWFDQDRVVMALPHLVKRHSEMAPDSLLSMLAEQASERPDRHGLTDELVFKTHWMCNDAHPFIDRSTRAIFLVRDPRDVLLSGANYKRLRGRLEGMSDTEYAMQFIRKGGDATWIGEGYGGWAEHASSWLEQRRFPVHAVRYEDLKSDPVETFGAVIDFAGWPRDDERIRAAVESASMRRLRSLEMGARKRKATQISKASSEHFFINKGKTGQTLDALGEAVAEAFADRFGEPASRFGYDVSCAPAT